MPSWRRSHPRSGPASWSRTRTRDRSRPASTGRSRSWTTAFTRTTASTGWATSQRTQTVAAEGGEEPVTAKDGKSTTEHETGNFEGCAALFKFDSAAALVLTFFGRFPGGSASGDPEVIHKVRHLHFSI